MPKLIDGLKILEKEEWISFRKYILMYCSKSSDCYILLDYLFNARNSEEKLSDTRSIKKRLNPKMTAKCFSNNMSILFIWFEEWLVWNENKKNGVANNIQLVGIYNRKGFFNLADKTMRSVEKPLMDKTLLDLRKHKDLYLLYHHYYFGDNPVKNKSEIFNRLISNFLLQFKEQALLYISEMHNWGDIQNFDYNTQIELLRLISSLVEDSQTSKFIELINILISELSEEAFLEIRDTITSNRIKRDSELYVLASLYMITFSLRLWNINKIKDPQLVIDAYDFGLQSGLLLSTGRIPLIRFLNLVSTLGYVKTSTGTYLFIDKWIHMVDSNNLESIHALAYAQLKLVEGKIEEIVPLLIDKKFTSNSGKLRASSLELISLYYERNSNYSLLINRISNFKRVLSRRDIKNKHLGYHNYLNFTKVLELLIKRDFQKMIISIEDYLPLIHKRWLIREIKAGQ